MPDDDMMRLLAGMTEQQNKLLEQQAKLLEELRAAKAPPAKKDFWDRTMAVAPIVSAAIIACIGAYFTYTYNLQQLKVQEIQTIERFLPHLAGDERNKRAAVLAISSLGNAKLAAKVASVFASKGTASALTSLAGSSDPSDQQVVREALYKTLDALSERTKAESRRADAEARAKVTANEADSNDSDICDNLNKLAEIYKQKGDTAAAEEVERRSAALMKRTAGDQTASADTKSAVAADPASNAKPVDGAELAAVAKAKQASDPKPVKVLGEIHPVRAVPESKPAKAPTEPKPVDPQE